MGSPVQRPLIQIGRHKWGLQQEPKATVNFTAKQASASTGNAVPNSNNEDLKRQGGEVLSDYEIARRKQIKENAVRLRNIMASHNNIRPHSPQQPAKLERTQTTNNCGVHTIIRIFTAHNPRLLEKLSTNFIEKNSMVIRAWLFSRLISPSTRQAWDQSLLNFIRVVSHDKWFKISASKRVTPQDRRDALSTLLPDQYKKSRYF